MGSRRHVGRIVAVVIALAGIAATAVFAPGCGKVVEGKAEKAVADLLPQYLGLADAYKVKVSGRTGAMLRGRLGHVHIEGKNVRLAEGLTVSGLTLDLRDVSVDRGEGRLQNIAAARFSARIAEPDLNRYVGGNRPGMRDLQITTGADGKLVVRARPELLGYPTLPVEVRGILMPREEGTKLDFFPDKGKVSIVPLPLFVVEHLTNRLNPVVDLSSGIALPIVVESTAVERGALTLHGTLPSEALLRAAEQAVSAAEAAPTRP